MGRRNDFRADESGYTLKNGMFDSKTIDSSPALERTRDSATTTDVDAENVDLNVPVLAGD